MELDLTESICAAALDTHTALMPSMAGFAGPTIDRVARNTRIVLETSRLSRNRERPTDRSRKPDVGELDRTGLFPRCSIANGGRRP